MANLDTPQKRASALSVGGEQFGMYMPSSGGIDAAGERQAAAFSYSGIAAGAAQTVLGLFGDRRRRAAAVVMFLRWRGE